MPIIVSAFSSTFIDTFDVDIKTHCLFIRITSISDFHLPVCTLVKYTLSNGF